MGSGISGNTKNAQGVDNSLYLIKPKQKWEQAWNTIKSDLKLVGIGLIFPIYSLVNDCLAHPRPSYKKFLQDIGLTLTFVAAIVATVVTAGTSFYSLVAAEALCVAGEAADLAIDAAADAAGAAAEIAEGATGTIQTFDEVAQDAFSNLIDLSTAKGKFDAVTNAIQVFGQVLNLSAKISMSPSGNAETLANDTLSFLQVFTSTYGTLEMQIAVNVAVVATTPGNQKDPYQYLLAAFNGAGENGGTDNSALFDNVFGRELSTTEKYAFQTLPAVVACAYLAGQKDPNIADYFNAVGNSLASAGTFYAIGNIQAEFAPSYITTSNPVAADKNGNPNTNATQITGKVKTWTGGEHAAVLTGHKNGHNEYGTVGNEVKNLVVGSIVSAQYGTGTTYIDVTLDIMAVCTNLLCNYDNSPDTNVTWDEQLVAWNPKFQLEPDKPPNLVINYTLPSNAALILQNGSFSFTVVSDTAQSLLTTHTYANNSGCDGKFGSAVVSAIYGQGTQVFSVEELVKAWRVNNFYVPANGHFYVQEDNFGGDPTLGGHSPLTLTITSYTPKAFVYDDNTQCTVPLNCLGVARYGEGDNVFDVTHLVRDMKDANGNINFKTEHAWRTWLDPAPGHLKYLSVTCTTPVAGDFFTEGKTRFGLWDPTTGNWHIKGSKGEPDIVFQHGLPGDVPLGCADIFNEGFYRTITWRPSTGEWTCKGPGTKSWNDSKNNVIFQHGIQGDVPLVANIFGDGNRAITYRRGNGTWNVKGLGKKSWNDSSDNVVFQHGKPGDCGEQPLVGTLFGDGMRAIIYRAGEGKWHCKGLGEKDWDKSDDNVIVQNGILCDQPFIADILGDGPRACVFRKKEGKIYVKNKGRGNWDSKGTFGDNQTITCVFAGSTGTLANGNSGDHDVAFMFSPSSATTAKGHIYLVIFRGVEQMFYVQTQSGMRVSSFDPIKFWTGFNGNGLGSSAPWTVNSLSTADLKAAKQDIRKHGVFTFKFGNREDIPMFADFFNENICRAGVFRPSNGRWYVKGVKLDPDVSFQCGSPNTKEVPMVGDIFNEGKSRVMVWQPATGTWFIKGFGKGDYSEHTGGVTFEYGKDDGKDEHGLRIPMIADIFGDGVRAIIYDQRNSEFLVSNKWSPGSGAWVATSFKVGPNNFGVPLVANIFNDGPRAIVYSRQKLNDTPFGKSWDSDGTWYCKAVGKSDWGKTPKQTPVATNSAHIDVMFQSGEQQDVPIVSNVLGFGFRAINLRPDSRQWLFKAETSAAWGADEDIAADLTNDSGNTPHFSNEGDLPYYQRTVNSVFWPLNYKPFLNNQAGDYPTFVDMRTMTWYVNFNPKRTNW